MRCALIVVLLFVLNASYDARAIGKVGVTLSSGVDIVAVDRLRSRETTTTPAELVALLPRTGRTADGPALIWLDGTVTPLEDAPGYWRPDAPTRTLTIGLSHDQRSPLAPTVYRLFDLDRPGPGIELFRTTPIAEGTNVLLRVQVPSGKAIIVERLAPVSFGFVALRESNVWLNRVRRLNVQAELPASYEPLIDGFERAIAIAGILAARRTSRQGVLDSVNPPTRQFCCALLRVSASTFRCRAGRAIMRLTTSCSGLASEGEPLSPTFPGDAPELPPPECVSAWRSMTG